MVDIRIISSQEQDLEEIFYLDNLVFSNEGYSFLVLRQLYDICGDLLIVAKNPESKVVGYTVGCPKINTLDSWILALAVDPQYRHQGIGRELTSYLLCRFIQMKMSYAFLTVDPQNTIAINLYFSLGFKVMTWKANYFGENSPRNIMRKDLLL